MNDPLRCPTCGAELDDPGSSSPICVPCAFGLALHYRSQEAPTAEMAEPTTPHSTPGEKIGPYRLGRVLGEGGMGIVWEALQEEPVRRRVALKRIKVGMDSAQVLARFESERQALALMNHPHIAQVFDAGRTAEGHPYFAMEYVEGTWLNHYCDAHKLSVPKRLDLFLLACGAIQHAHHKGVIHRDIKPSNILVQTVENGPTPKIIDFGVAKAIGAQLTERTLVTQLGQALGTLEYMSPEQAGPAGFDVDTRADVYSLGVVLYELLTGQLPFEVASGDHDELRRRIREDDPKRPSARVAALTSQAAVEVARSREAEPAALARQLRGDLDWIVLKALAKDRGKRYGSPGELAADLQRHIAGQPVLAGPPSASYRLSKFVGRHKLGVTAAALILLLLVTTAVGMAVQAQRVARERDRANREAQTAGAALEFLTDLFRLSEPEQGRGETITAREILEKGAADIEKKLSGAPEVQVELTMTIGRVYRNLGLYSQAALLLEEALQRRRPQRGADDPVTLRLAAETAWLYSLQGRSEEAEALQRETLAIQRRVLGPDHPNTLDSMNNLANALRSLGRYEEAVTLHRQTLEARKRVLGPENPDTLSSMNNLATASQAMGRDKEAEELFRQTLDIRKRTIGPEHPETLSSMNNVAAMHWMLGRHKEAEAIFHETLEIQKRVLGPEHRETLTSMTRLADSCSAQGRYQQAEALHRQTLEIRKRVLGLRHPETLKSMYDVACAVAQRGARSAALQYLREAVELGFSDVTSLLEDSDLTSLRGDPAFEKIAATARVNQESAARTK